jgi:hypothetical protein
MTKPHIHAEFIKQWAEGQTIQYWSGSLWFDCPDNEPSWKKGINYRVKPEPKPDVVMYAMVKLISPNGVAQVQSVNADRNKTYSDTCMFVFDGETGVLKSAQVLAHV